MREGESDLFLTAVRERARYRARADFATEYDITQISFELSKQLARTSVQAAELLAVEQSQQLSWLS